MNLTKFQINAVRSMARGLAPLQRKLDRIHTKEVAFAASIAEEKEELEKQINQINSAIETYTGGYTVNEVLNPESTIPAEAPEGVADENEQVEMTEIIPTITEEAAEVAPEVEQILEEGIAEANSSVESQEETPVTTTEAEERPFWDVAPTRTAN